MIYSLQLKDGYTDQLILSNHIARSCLSPRPSIKPIHKCHYVSSSLQNILPLLSLFLTFPAACQLPLTFVLCLLSKLALDPLPSCIGGDSMTPLDIDLLVCGLLTASISSPRLPLYEAALDTPGRAEAGRDASWLGAKLRTLLRVLEVR
jgi:hypothetical protein